MPHWTCTTCGVEYPDNPEPQAGDCPICADERQYLPEGGQRWTTLGELHAAHTATLAEIEPGLYAITVTPSVGIGHRPLIVCTPEGNVLWDAPGFIDDALVEEIRAIGGLAVITSSHPHLTGVASAFSAAFGGIPIWYGEDDRQWLQRPDPAIRFWRGTQDVMGGITLHQCGGHFMGSAVLHWPTGAEGRGVLLTGDTIMLNADRETFSFMRSYPNRIPLSPRSVQRIIDSVAPLAFDRVYSGFAPGVLATGAKDAVRRSAERQIGWMRDELRDPADSDELTTLGTVPGAGNG